MVVFLEEGEELDDVRVLVVLSLHIDEEEEEGAYVCVELISCAVETQHQRPRPLVPILVNGRGNDLWQFRLLRRGRRIDGGDSSERAVSDRDRFSRRGRTVGCHRRVEQRRGEEQRVMVRTEREVDYIRRRKLTDEGKTCSFRRLW